MRQRSGDFFPHSQTFVILIIKITFSREMRQISDLLASFVEVRGMQLVLVGRRSKKVGNP
jgi:hypothetical protein